MLVFVRNQSLVAQALLIMVVLKWDQGIKYLIYIDFILYKVKELFKLIQWVNRLQEPHLHSRWMKKLVY